MKYGTVRVIEATHPDGPVTIYKPQYWANGVQDSWVTLWIPPQIDAITVRAEADRYAAMLTEIMPKIDWSRPHSENRQIINALLLEELQ